MLTLLHALIVHFDALIVHFDALAASFTAPTAHSVAAMVPGDTNWG